MVDLNVTENDPLAPDGGVQFEIGYIMLYETTQNAFLILLELNGLRQFRIEIGSVEAWTILSMVKQQTYDRPLTHAAMLLVIKSLGGRVEKIVIDELDEYNVYHAILHIRRGKEKISVDIRPSDAFAIAIASQSQIYIAVNLAEKKEG